MDKFTAEKLRAEFIRPLKALVRKLEDSAEELETSFDTGALAKDWLPLNQGGKYKGGTAGLKMLQAFERDEVKRKLRSAKEGNLRYAEYERLFAAKNETGKETK